MEPDEVASRLIEIAKDPDCGDNLQEAVIRLKEATLYDRCIEHFGSWDAALAEALKHAAGNIKSSSAATANEETLDDYFDNRPVDRVSQLPFVVIGTSGAIALLKAKHVPCRRNPDIWSNLPADYSQLEIPCAFFNWNDNGRFIALSDQGTAFTFSDGVLADLEDCGYYRAPSDYLHLATGEKLRWLLPNARLHGKSRVLHITRQGKIKASDNGEFKNIDAGGSPGFLLNEGDGAVQVMTDTPGDTIFALGSYGNGIHFRSNDVRSMGRRSVGVVAKKLEPGENIVGAFNSTGLMQVVVITARGFAKRMELSDFRLQDRAGSGMVALKPPSGDRLISAVGVDIYSDLLAITVKGSFMRVPARLAQFKSRAAKAEPLYHPAAGDEIAFVQATPPGELA